MHGCFAGTVRLYHLASVGPTEHFAGGRPPVDCPSSAARAVEGGVSRNHSSSGRRVLWAKSVDWRHVFRKVVYNPVVDSASDGERRGAYVS